MSLAIPLAVTLVSATRSLDVTREVRDLTFRSVVPGGFASAAVSLDRPLTLDHPEIAYYGRLIVSDTRHAGTIWEGRLEDPGRSAGRNGQVWDLVAVGPAGHASDRTVPYIVVERNLTNFMRALTDISPGGHADTREDPGGSGNPCIFLQLPTGLAVNNGSRVVMRFDDIFNAGQKVAWVDYSWDAGLTNADWRVRFVARTGGTAGNDIARTQTTSTGGSGLDDKVVVTDWTNGRDQVDLELVYTNGAATVGGDTGWAAIMNVAVQAMRYNADGTEKTSGYTATVTDADVVADLLGRILDQYDGTTAAITTASPVTIEQMAYPDAVTPRQVLADLITLAPSRYWAAWEQQANGKYRFEWTAWPEFVRYHADVVDGYDSTGSADGLYNAVRVRFRGISGLIRTVQRTNSVTELTNAGLTREAFLDLGDDIGSQANAEAAGDEFLARHAFPPNAGRLTIARPIYSAFEALVTSDGRMVMPWEIRPGHLIRVRGIQPSAANLAGTTRDGVAIFRLTAVEFSARTGVATLELDSPPPSTASALAVLQRRPDNRRR